MSVVWLLKIFQYFFCERNPINFNDKCPMDKYWQKTNWKFITKNRIGYIEYSDICLYSKGFYWKCLWKIDGYYPDFSPSFLKNVSYTPWSKYCQQHNILNWFDKCNSIRNCQSLSYMTHFDKFLETLVLKGKEIGWRLGEINRP